MAAYSESTQTSNFTDPERNNSSPKIYEYMYDDHVSYIIYYCVLILILVVGPLLCFPIVLYERYGGDRQKRTIINRLCSLIFTNIAFQSCNWSMLRIMRDIFGLLPTHITNIVALISNTVELSSLLFVTELTMFRFLYIVVWRRMKTIEDDFWNFVLTMSTFLVALFFSLSVHICGGQTYGMGHIVDVTEHKETRYIITFDLYFLKLTVR